MLKKIFAIVSLLVLLFVGIVWMQPTEFRIARSATMSATPEVVFAQVNDFHAWQAWSPWAKKDPNAKASYEGPGAGPGAVFHWAGNEDVGEGSMTIVESEPNERILIRLDFIKPFESTDNAEFTFEAEDEQTKVTWAMLGTNSFVEKIFFLLMDVDKMVGQDFEQGLANMRQLVESPATDEPTDAESAEG